MPDKKSEFSGVEKAADTVLWVYSDESMKRDKEVRIGIAKARKGDTYTEGTFIMADYAHGAMFDIGDNQDQTFVEGAE